MQSFKDLYIGKPCNEDWDQMTSNSCGNYCNKCNETVYDFTDKNFDDFLELYNENNGKICIRIPSDEIGNKPIRNRLISKPLNYLKSSILSLIAFFTFTNVAFGQSEKDITATEIIHNYEPLSRRSDIKTISGRIIVTDARKTLEWSDVKVKIYQNNRLIGVTKTENGYFEYKTTNNIADDDEISIKVIHKKYVRRRRGRVYKRKIKSAIHIVEDKNLENIEIPIDYKSKRRRQHINRINPFKRRYLMGCPKFR